jgi:hypothetical protein
MYAYYIVLVLYRNTTLTYFAKDSSYISETHEYVVFKHLSIITRTEKQVYQAVFSNSSVFAEMRSFAFAHIKEKTKMHETCMFERIKSF